MEPITRIILYKNVPFRPDYSCVTDFESEAQRWDYLQKFHPRAFTNRLYIKYNDVNTLNIKFDEIHGVYNYMAYSNEQNENGVNINYKFAFITDIRWASQNSTFARIMPDVYQNELFNFSLASSLIEREHQNRYTSAWYPIYNYENDIVYNPDICNEYLIDRDTSHFYLIFVFSDIPNLSETPFHFYESPSLTSLRGGDGYVYFIVKCSRDFTDSNSQIINTKEFSDFYSTPELYKVYISPVLILEGNFAGTALVVENVGTIDGYTLSNDITVDYEYEKTISLGQEGFITSNADISPSRDWRIYKEPKLLTLPYKKISIICGNTINTYSIPYAQVENRTITVKSRISISADGVKASVYLPNYVGDYNGVLSATNITACAELPLKNDVWKNYLSTHSAVLFPEIISSIFSGVNGVVGGIATLNPSTIGAGVTSFANIGVGYANAANLEQTPQTIKSSSNSAVGEINSRSYGMRISIVVEELNNEFKRNLCHLWYWYGYPCNRVKKPDLRSRYYFNYIKTNGAVINNVTDHAERKIIENIFNNGVTIYHCRTINGEPFVCDYGDCVYENTEVSLL